MQSKNSTHVQDRFKEQLKKLATAAGVKVEDLTKVQKSVAFAHFVNHSFGLQSIDRNGEAIECPKQWNNAPEGVYKINYRLKSQDLSQKNIPQKIIQFRFVDNQQEDGSISINYSLQDSQELNQYELKYQKEKSDDHYKAYLKDLQEKLNKKKQTLEANSNIRNLQPVLRQPQNYHNRPNVPMGFNRPNQQGNPFHVPFTGGEYIGPENQIFRDRGINNPLQINPNERPQFDIRRPPGSRFDPVDPFGGQGVDQPNKRDFMGFNEFGKPLGGGGGKGGFNGLGGGIGGGYGQSKYA